MWSDLIEVKKFKVKLKLCPQCNVLLYHVLQRGLWRIGIIQKCQSPENRWQQPFFKKKKKAFVVYFMSKHLENFWKHVSWTQYHILCLESSLLLFWYSWDLLQNIKCSADLEFCFSVCLHTNWCMLSKTGSWYMASECAGRRSSVPGALAQQGISWGEASALSSYDTSIKESCKESQILQGMGLVALWVLIPFELCLLQGANTQQQMKLVCEDMALFQHGGKSVTSVCATELYRFSWACLM